MSRTNTTFPAEYICDKCKIPGKGGFSPTLFIFDHGGVKADLCRPCYEEFWKSFNEIEKKFVEDFFKP